jgi:hypothetical protein
MTMIGPIGQVAVLLVRADEEDRASARQIEDEADQAAMKDANDRVAELRAKSDADRNGALASGIGDIASGAFAMGGALFAPTSAANGSAAGESSTSGHRVDWNAMLSGCGKAMAGVGSLFASQYKGEANTHDAEAARLEAQSQADIRQYDRAQSDEQAANASIQKIEQLVDQMQQTEDATRLATATFHG